MDHWKSMRKWTVEVCGHAVHKRLGSCKNEILLRRCIFT